jgi:CRP/FNR family transcriptional regulator
MQTSDAGFTVAQLVTIFQKCPLFQGVSDSDLEDIASITVCKSFEKGDYLFHEGAAVHGFYIVFSGAVKVHRVSFGGKEQVIHVYRPNESFGEEALICELGYPADASAIETSQVLMVQKPEFLALLRRQPELALYILRSMSQHLNDLVDLLDNLTLKDVKTRLANWLIQHCPNPESYEPYSIQLPMTKRVLAAELGTVSETFSRTVAKLRKQRLLAVDGNTFTLLCPIKLTRLFGNHIRNSAGELHAA